MSRGRLLIDCNLLVLLIVGAASKDFIGRHKRTRGTYTAEDFDLLVAVIDGSPGIVLTPYTLTETYNLAHSIAEPARSQIMASLSRLIDGHPEHYLESTIACRHKDFARLGLVDAILLEMAGFTVPAGRPTLLTVDLDLAIAAEIAGHAVINFNHLRDPGGAD